YSENYKKSKSFMSKESSFDINSKNNSLINFSKLIGLKSSKNEFNNVHFQIVKENEILHINGIIDNYNTENIDKEISKIFNTKIKGEIVMNPHFVTNHITKAKEIVVQDNNNYLYLISNQGKVIWKKKLVGKILGEIKQIDLYKNGRLQLIFVTNKRLYVLDRNGKEVKPFPKVFKDKITQPLSVFDYDNNKNYRFLVTQGNELLMYDSKGKIVKGFKYEKSSDILYSPKHYRIKNKDIIAVKTERDLKILNRRGKIRIKIKDNINFSNSNVFRLNNYLICTSKKGNLVQIDMNGSVSVRKLNLSNSHKINSKYNLVSIIDGNKLTNLNKSIDLPYGNYSDPIIFSYNKIKKFSIFDSQSKKIYLFDDKLNLHESFPLYSISNIDLNNIDKDQNLELILTEDESTIRLYEISN
ncbi:MAG TPA: ribonuclease HII, partial [Flavobacteriaceae bacterium]|nr:ribonuclease HII [Flavobacteriaceae bacterium]